MNDGYMGRFLFIDLTNRSVSRPPVPEWLKTDYIGGKGFGARLLTDLCPTGADPMGPDNPLMFFTGPLTSTAAPSMRACMVTKSPLTGLYLDSFFGGRFGPEIKYAGYDGIVIVGCADTPTYLWIGPEGRVAFRDAAAIWGQNALEANRSVKQDLHEPEAQVVTIGQAGENRVLFSLVTCEYNRQAGRGGAGAVMGAKNLKAVAVKGKHLVKVHHPESFSEACRRSRSELSASQEVAALSQFGTSAAVSFSAAIGSIPFRNFQNQADEAAEKLGDTAQGRHLFLAKAACFGCPIHCSQMGAVRTGKFATFVTDTVEYESAAMMGANLDIHDIRAVAHLTRLCDEYGLDTISAGNVIGFAFEAAERGIIAAPAGVDLRFGSIDGAEYLLEAIAARKGPLGRLLAGGVKRAGDKIGKKASDYAMHVKGMEVPAWGPRGTPGMGLAYMTSDRGACHQRGFMISYELAGEPFEGKPVQAETLAGKAEILRNRQDYLSGTDTLVKCDFGAMGISADSYARMLSAATGRNADPAAFSLVGERIWNLTRLFNLREGMKTEDERLPKRVEDPLPGGPLKGKKISGKDAAYMLADYYRIRGWDEQGRPRKETLKRLNLIDAPTFVYPTDFSQEKR